MKRLGPVTLLGLLVMPVFARPELVAARGVRYASWDHTTGQWVSGDSSLRSGDSIWAATQRSGYYFPSTTIDFGGVGDREWLTIDWGDVAGPVRVGGFTISYGCDYYLPRTMDCLLLFYTEENGYNSAGRELVAGFTLTDLPGQDPGGIFHTWTLTFDLDVAGATFTLDGSDLDGDGLVDFGYAYLWNQDDLAAARGSNAGPTIAGDPNADPPTAPGIEDAFDVLERDPNELNGFRYIETQGSPFTHYGVFAQFFMELFASEHCPYAGVSGSFCFADVAGEDCVVDLSDLAQLLANFGVTTGATHDMGDVEPDDGDGDVDLQDLAALLAQYGDDCSQPPP